MTSILFLVETIQCKNSVPFISKTKKFYSIVLCIFQIYVKFWTFSKKDDPHNLRISEITDSERRG